MLLIYYSSQCAHPTIPLLFLYTTVIFFANNRSHVQLRPAQCHHAGGSTDSMPLAFGHASRSATSHTYACDQSGARHQHTDAGSIDSLSGWPFNGAGFEIASTASSAGARKGRTSSAPHYISNTAQTIAADGERRSLCVTPEPEHHTLARLTPARLIVGQAAAGAQPKSPQPARTQACTQMNVNIYETIISNNTYKPHALSHIRKCAMSACMFGREA